MFTWEKWCFEDLPRSFKFDPTGTATRKTEIGELTVYYDWQVDEDEPGLVITATPTEGPEEQWTPDSPEEFWRDLRAAEEYLEWRAERARAQDSYR